MSSVLHQKTSFSQKENDFLFSGSVEPYYSINMKQKNLYVDRAAYQSRQMTAIALFSIFLVHHNLISSLQSIDKGLFCVWL
eukprot:c19050_g1_i1 orf=107-349(+)